MDRDRMDARENLLVDEWETLEVIELPERELMCGCGGTSLLGGLSLGLGGTSASAGFGATAGPSGVNAGVNLGFGSGSTCGG